MFSLASLLVAASLVQADPTFRMLDLSLKAQIEEQQRRNKEVNSLKKKDFEQRFDRLASAMRQFADSYNREGGAIWPAKQADELRKALKELQELEEFGRGRK